MSTEDTSADSDAPTIETHETPRFDPEVLANGTPVAAGTVVAEAVVTEPAAAEPVVTEPVAVEPVAAEPAVTEPAAAEPVVAEPAVTEPVAADPVVAEPVAAEPVVAEAAPQAPAPAPVEPVTAAVVATVQEAAPAVRPIALPPLDESLQAAGMQMIETRASTAEYAPPPPKPLGRARKPVAQAASEPLQQVETSN